MPTEVHLIRHGQSEFNRIWDVEGRDPLIRDAPLSQTGLAQVAAAQAAALALAPDVVITSPLTRAIQTAVGLYGGSGVPIEVTHLHAERLTNTDDIGSPPAELARRFAELRFDHLPERWWYDGPLDDLGVPVEPGRHFHPRVAAWVDMLHTRPEERVVVVGHSTFFERVLGRWLQNCEIVALPLPVLLAPRGG